jgi:hypothetical protein
VLITVLKSRLFPAVLAVVCLTVPLLSGSANASNAGNPGPAAPDPGIPKAIPLGGTQWHNFCGSYWKNIISDGVGFNIYNDDWSGVRTCLYNNNNPGFVITRSDADGGYHAFPNISSGWQWGVAPLHGFYYPVQLRSDGHPLSSVSIAWNTAGIYNAAYDMWFSTYKQTNGQDNGAEVMIWLNCSRNCIGLHSPTVTIEGIKFHEDSWLSFARGVHWHYTAFVMIRHRTSVSNLWLNPFYWAAHVNPK